ncbi:hypothetical protein Pcinc_004251 [Petrolisthes cinctipes]|uniref:WH2 domain-containing protein n=1 Tax=Petrolisthes cinctipes TaxID=88211 RepID=A0AAE1L1A5_PETCI|nr:hypothetical protein Pcinc_004251 [Petrolisthes cinctipes]
MFKSQANIVLQDGRGNDKSKMQNNPNMDQGGNNSNNDMPGMFGGMMGPGFMGPGNMMGPGGDAQLADEFMKLQQDFFKWQQQLLQNQHILHSRVAPLATNPPNLQSVGVMRDIMGGQGSSGDPGVTEARNTTLVERHGPVERVINITFEEGPAHTDETQLRTLPRMAGHNVMDLTKDMSQLNTGNFPSEPQPRRWGGEPSVSVGSWSDRPSQPVSVHQDTDYTTSHQQPQPQFQQQPQPQFQQQPQPQFQQQPQPQFQQQPQPRFQQQPQPQFQQQPQQHFQPQQFQSLPQEQKDQFAQFLQQQPQRQWPPPQQQQQQQEQQQQQQQQQLLKWQPPSQQPPSRWQQQQQQPSKPKPQPVQPQPPPQPKWSSKQPLDSSELENRTSFWQKMGKQQEGSEVETEPTRPPRRSPPQDTPRQTESSQGRNFGDQVNVNEPPRSYFYNGEPNAAPQGSGRAGPGQEGDSGSPRYTSVVTVTNDKPEAGKDKVRSVVQLNTTNQGPTPGAPGQHRPAPVVRGFRQPGEDPAGQNAGNFPSRILNNVSRNQRSSVSPPSVNGSSLVSEAPTAARLVAAVSQPPKAPSPSMTPAQATSRPSPPRSSPSRASPLTNFQQRPSPPPASPPAAPPAPGPPPPPAPPMAPPGPPPPPAPPGPPPPPAPPMAPPPPKVADGIRRTSTGKKIVTAKGGPELDAREELMMAIKNHGGLRSLKRTRGEDFECQ